MERAAAEGTHGAAHAEAEHSGSEDGIAEHRGSASKARCCCMLGSYQSHVIPILLTMRQTVAIQALHIQRAAAFFVRVGFWGHQRSVMGRGVAQALRYTPFGNGMRNCVGARPLARMPCYVQGARVKHFAVNTWFGDPACCLEPGLLKDQGMPCQS